MGLFFKTIPVPESNETKEVEAVQLWYVRWYSRYGEFHGSTRKEVECFTSKQAANEFAAALRKAFALVRHTSGDNVSVDDGSRP